MSSGTITHTTINELPQEVVESIIDLLADERDALKSCALVQHAWLSRARHHLHRELTIECSKHQTLQPDYYSTGAAAYIHSLKLIAAPPPPVLGSSDAQARTVWSIIPRLTSLRSLTLVFSNWTAADAARERLRPATQHITDLNLVFATFATAADLFALVALFPALERLALTSVSFGTSALTAIPPAPPASLTALRVRGHLVPPAVTRTFALWLCRLPRPAIPHFELAWEAGQPECLVPVLDGLGSRLAHLDLPLWAAQHVPSEVVKTALHLLTLVSQAPAITEADVDHILAFLGRIATTELHRLELSIRTTASLEAVDESALRALDDVLFGTHARFAFPNLETVRFAVPPALGSESIEERLKKTMPRALGRRALEVEVVKGA